MHFCHDHLSNAIFRYRSRNKTSALVQPDLNILGSFEEGANAAEHLCGVYI